jgi:hypothetical protein
VITATILTAIGSNLILCDQYMSIVMTGKMYAQSYKDKGLHPKNLSRAIEDSATVTANLVPWNSGGAYQAATLGVPTIAYLPFNFFCWLTPIVSMLYGWFNITIDPLEEEMKYPTWQPNKVPFNPDTLRIQASRGKGTKEIRTWVNISALKYFASIAVRAMDGARGCAGAGRRRRILKGSALEGILNVANCASAWKWAICPLR